MMGLCLFQDEIMSRSLTTLLRYKLWIDELTLQAIACIDAGKFAEKRHLAVRLMNHVFVVDTIFKANLTGQPHGFTALNTPDTPAIDTLIREMSATTRWYLAHVATLTEADLAETLHFRFVDGGTGEMQAEEMLHHMLFHGTYHRGAVGGLLSASGVTPPKDVLSVFLRDHAKQP